MAFALNTRSFMLHTEDHADGDNVDTFERADEADKVAHAAGKKLTFCKQCFPGNRNSVQADALAEAEAALTERTPTRATNTATESARPAGDARTMPDLASINTTQDGKLPADAR